MRKNAAPRSDVKQKAPRTKKKEERPIYTIVYRGQIVPISSLAPAQ
jgi:hypothetical protein